MTITATRRAPAKPVDWQAEAGRWKARAVEAEDEVRRLRAPNMSWLQAKVVAQRAANDALQVRHTSVRAALRRIERLGRGLTRDEWAAARADEAHLRTTEEPPVA